MNILILAEVSACKVGGGADRMLREQSIALHKRGHNVCLLVRESPNDTAAQSSFEGITEYRYQVNNTSAISFVISSIRNSTLRFDEIITSGFSPDCVIIDQSLAGIGPILFRNRHCSSWIYQSFSLAHEEFLTRNAPGKSIKERFIYFLNVKARLWIERWTMNQADCVIIMSEFMKQRVIANHMIPENKIRLLPGAADTSRFKPPSDKRQAKALINLDDRRTLLFTVRNLVPRMGLENLINAIAEMGPKCDNTFLVIAGTGQLKDSLENLVHSLNLADRIKFAGFLPDEQLPLYYQAADLVLMPTLTLEGFGLVTVEALACGTPVLGTPVGATPEILSQIDERLLANGYSAHALAESLGHILNIIRLNPGDWMQISEKGLKYVRMIYNWNTHGELLEALIKKCSVKAAINDQSII